MFKYFDNIELPPVLDEESTRNLFVEMRQGNQEAYKSLISHNLRLVFPIAQKYSNENNYDDICSEGVVGLIKAVKTYSLDKKITFSTYSCTCIRNQILMVTRKDSTRNKHITASLDEEIKNQTDLKEVIFLKDCISTSEDIIDKAVLRRDLNDYLKNLIICLEERLKPDDYYILFSFYGLNGLPRKNNLELAQEFGTTSSSIRSNLSHIRCKVKNILQNDAFLQPYIR